MGEHNANLFDNQHVSSSFSHWIDGTNSKTDLPVSPGYQSISNEGYKHLLMQSPVFRIAQTTASREWSESDTRKLACTSEPCRL